MKLGNLNGRAVVIGAGNTYVDVAEASDARFGPAPQSVFEQWDDFTAWAAGLDLDAGQIFDPADLGAPVPAPRQVVAIGLNYDDHASESGFRAPSEPTVFTKFPSSIAGPDLTVTLPEGGNTDWEVEMVVVIGRTARNASVEGAWSYVAGITVGQDLSERVGQLSGPVPQFSLGKSHENFAPTGPWLVTLDEFENPDDLEIGCSINGEQMQKGRTKDLIFSVPELISRLSAVMPLLPGDVIFTGTPAGVGLGRDPQVWLKPGDELVSWVEGVGEIRQKFVNA
jgi:2-keto-4-pentenoate hydratase/2-oxohepta-3-ene-1,7-dioic acid hydratase in catechol pathway